MRDKYFEEKSIHYGIGHTRRRKILELIGSTHNKRVLDVGCSRGYLGEIIKKIGNYVVGVEVSREASAEAKKVLDEVITFNVEEQWPTSLQEKKFDLIIFGELLGHVFDPAVVLNSASQVLNPGGLIIITIPNFLTMTNRIGFLLGRFAYQDQGRFDFGHIRFFTYSFLKNIISESGFKIVGENNIIFPGKLTTILKHWPSLFASHFIVKLEKL